MPRDRFKGEGYRKKAHCQRTRDKTSNYAFAVPTISVSPMNSLNVSKSNSLIRGLREAGASRFRFAQSTANLWRSPFFQTSFTSSCREKVRNVQLTCTQKHPCCLQPCPALCTGLPSPRFRLPCSQPPQLRPLRSCRCQTHNPQGLSQHRVWHF